MRQSEFMPVAEDLLPFWTAGEALDAFMHFTHVAVSCIGSEDHVIKVPGKRGGIEGYIGGHDAADVVADINAHVDRLKGMSKVYAMEVSDKRKAGRLARKGRIMTARGEPRSSRRVPVTFDNWVVSAEEVDSIKRSVTARKSVGMPIEEGNRLFDDPLAYSVREFLLRFTRDAFLVGYDALMDVPVYIRMPDRYRRRNGRQYPEAVLRDTGENMVWQPRPSPRFGGAGVPRFSASVPVDLGEWRRVVAELSSDAYGVPGSQGGRGVQGAKSRDAHTNRAVGSSEAGVGTDATPSRGGSDRVENRTIRTTMQWSTDEFWDAHDNAARRMGRRINEGVIPAPGSPGDFATRPSTPPLYQVDWRGRIVDPHEFERVFPRDGDRFPPMSEELRSAMEGVYTDAERMSAFTLFDGRTGISLMNRYVATRPITGHSRFGPVMPQMGTRLTESRRQAEWDSNPFRFVDAMDWSNRDADDMRPDGLYFTGHRISSNEARATYFAAYGVSWVAIRLAGAYVSTRYEAECSIARSVMEDFVPRGMRPAFPLSDAINSPFSQARFVWRTILQARHGALTSIRRVIGTQNDTLAREALRNYLHRHDALNLCGSLNNPARDTTHARIERSIDLTHYTLGDLNNPHYLNVLHLIENPSRHLGEPFNNEYREMLVNLHIARAKRYVLTYRPDPGSNEYETALREEYTLISKLYDIASSINWVDPETHTYVNQMIHSMVTSRISIANVRRLSAHLMGDSMVENRPQF